ncbi:MAG: SLATT domain-containing protein [Bacteroidetes bacterium]|nr:SLATT domain-containing protein [Bacteroidota bacterium]
MDTERKTYIEDLETWLWTTKGIRFYTHERYLSKNRWSNFSVGMMSAYIIIINLITSYKIHLNTEFGENTVSFITTALSILILVFSQLENSSDFKLRAEKFHDCSREISKLYRQLREKRREIIDDDKLTPFLNEITKLYEQILDKYENHQEIDYLYFIARHPKDFEMSPFKRISIRLKYYLNTLFIYHILILSPLIFLFI